MSAPAPARPAPAGPTPGTDGTPGTSPFTGTWPLVRLALRRDRLLIPIWTVVFVVLAASTAASTIEVYPEAASRRGIAETINATPAMLALYGRIYDENSLGAVALFKMGTLGAALVAVLTIIMTVRHTRAEEEGGRLELLGGGVLGRFAPLTAALTVVCGTSLLLGLLTAASLVSTGLPADGAVAFGLAWALSGIAYAGVAAIAAQLASSARAATGLAVSVLGATYLLRAVGDTSDQGGARWLSWLSPVGWAQQVRAFAGDRWWVLAVSAVFAGLAMLTGYVMVTRRDLGAGALPDRPGTARGSRWLASPEGLALRLHRGMLVVWTAAYVLLGYVLGGIVANVSTAFDSPGAREMIQRMGGQEGMTDAFLATEMSFLGIFTSAFAVQAMLRLHAEEATGHGESLLATPVSRLRWAGSHLLVATVGSVWLLGVAGLSAGSAVAASLGEPAYVGRLLGAALAQVPAVLVLVGIVVVVTGFVPRAAALGWAALVTFLLIGELGPLLRLDQWVLDISPYAHIPKLPGTAFTATPLLWLTAIAVALVGTGLLGLRHRDLD